MYLGRRCSSGRISPSSARFPLGPLLLYARGGHHASGGMTPSVGNWILASGPQGPQWPAKRFPERRAKWRQLLPGRSLWGRHRWSSAILIDSLGRARGRSSPICRRVRHGQAEFLPIPLPSAQRGVAPLPQLQNGHQSARPKKPHFRPPLPRGGKSAFFKVTPHRDAISQSHYLFVLST